MPSPLPPLAVADVVLLGAGPAGSAAARLLAARGHSVVIIARPPKGRGLAESLPPSSTGLFDALGLRALIDDARFIRATGNTVQWAARDVRIEPFDGTTRGYQVPRARFDTLLLDAAVAAGATLYANSIARRVERDGEVLSVAYDSPDGRQTIRGRWVLDCSGRAGDRGTQRLAKTGTGGAHHRHRRRVATHRAMAVDDDSHTLVESYAGGWAWSVPASAEQRFVTVMLDPSVTSVPGRAALGDVYRAEISRHRR